MCPACIAAAALAVAGGTTGGGLTAIALKKGRATKDVKTNDQQPKPQPKPKEESS